MANFETESQAGSVIEYEGDNETLIWKSPIEDFNLGSQLIVPEGQEAVFFRDGQALDLFGPGRYTLSAQNIPMLNQVCQIPADPNAAFHSEVYYISLTTRSDVKWGTDSKIRMFDPASGLHVELGASGEFSIRVADSRKLLLRVGTTSGLKQSLKPEELLGSGSRKGFFRAMVMTEVKSYLAQVIREKAINILAIDEHLIALSDALREKINSHLSNYGLTMPEFFVANIVLPDDPNFKRMKEQHAERSLRVRQEQIETSVAEAALERRTVEVRGESQLKIIGAQGEAEAKVIEAQGDAKAFEIQKTAEAKADFIRNKVKAEDMRDRNYTYQQETVRQVGLEATKAMKDGITDGLMKGLKKLAGIGAIINVVGKMLSKLRKPDKSITPAASDSDTCTWDCPNCGTKKITSKFCPECGAKCPALAQTVTLVKSNTWDCDCGAKNITSKFCPECGKPRGA